MHSHSDDSVGGLGAILGLQAGLLQILFLGVLWIFFHCGPMCGPIISGLRLDAMSGGSFTRGLILYQLGRALIYCMFGAIAGALGARLMPSPILAWTISLFFALLLSLKLLPLNSAANLFPSFLVNFVARISRSTHGNLRPFLLGTLLAFLPCMLVFWALGLAASTGSAGAGSLVMFALVVLTFPPLWLSVRALNRLWLSSRLRKWANVGPLFVSWGWTTLMALAYSDLISHFHISFKFLDQTFMLMFW